MTDIKTRNQPFFWATHFLRSLFRSGVRHLIISPGSRSAPLTLAAAALPRLQKEVILDERSAAFTALGIGKATNQPAALICTSGTAVANYFPAFIEARKSSVPLLVLSADRPPRLHGSGANQTIDQHHIFGNYPVFFQDAGEPVMNEKDIEKLRQLASQAVAGAIQEQGPVHLNFPFSKPLEPEQDFAEIITKENKELEDSFSTTIPRPRVEEFRFDDKLLQHIQKAETPLVIIGPLAPGTDTNSIFRLADALHAPVLSEQGIINPDIAVQGVEGFLRNPERSNSLEPDLILRFGRQPAGKSLLEAIKRWAPLRHIHFSDTEYRSDIAGATTDHVRWNGNSLDIKGLYGCAKAYSPDFRWKANFAVPPRCTAGKPFTRSDHVILSRSSLENTLSGLRTGAGNRGRNMTGNATTSTKKHEHNAPCAPRWLERWKEKEKNYFERSSRILGMQQTLTDGHIYHHLAPAIPKGWFTFFSNSFPARDRSMFGRWHGRNVYTNRGASGIDGITSTAMGVGIGANQAGILFTGDLAFLHDTNVLLNKKIVQQPLVVIVINNRGGSIFRMLPIVEHKSHFNTYFETPQQANITALVKSYGIHTQTITAIAELRQLDLEKVITQSESMLHVIECQTDPNASMQVRHKLWDEN